MSISLENSVKNYMKSKHIVVPDEWIPPCLQFIQDDNPGINVNNKKLMCEKVYEQWLHSDLTELASCCLPFGLSQKRLTTLNGHFVLQVNQVRDVGHPAYPQLQKLRKTDNANAAVSAEKQFQPLWEPKPTRMLLMQMTDGTSLVQGMEYRPIPQLNVNLKPGTKVVVAGNIRSRRGVLLLLRDQITVLGGATESLSIVNAAENILARALGKEETDEPHEMEEVVATQVPQSQMSQYYPSQVNRLPPPSQSLSQAERGRGRGIGRPLSSVNKKQNIFTAPPPPAFDEMADDDFLDSDLEAALNQIESQASSSTPINSNNRNDFASGRMNNSQMSNRSNVGSDIKARNSNAVSSQNTGSSSWQQSGMDMDMDDGFFTDDFDEEILLSAENADVEGSSLGSEKSVGLTHQATLPNSVKSSGAPPLFTNQNNKLLSRGSTPIRAVAPQKVNKFNATTLSSKNGKVTANQSKLTNFLTKQPSVKNNSNMSLKLPPSVSGAADAIDDDILIDFEEDIVAMEGVSEIRRDTKRMRTTNQTSTVTSMAKHEPFTYLFLIPEKSTQVQNFVVKGFIMTLTSKLEISDGNWKLAAVINDGSASREVDVDNEILCQLIGMTCIEFQNKKKEARLNPFNTTLQQQLSKSVSTCQQKLISLCSLLKLSLSPEDQRLRLIEISSVSSTTALQLSKRSRSF